jgi:hypothetical protein
MQALEYLPMGEEKFMLAIADNEEQKKILCDLLNPLGWGVEPDMHDDCLLTSEVAGAFMCHYGARFLIVCLPKNQPLEKIDLSTVHIQMWQVLNDP